MQINTVQPRRGQLIALPEFEAAGRDMLLLDREAVKVDQDALSVGKFCNNVGGIRPVTDLAEAKLRYGYGAPGAARN